ncbi:MAG TPA: hypothetical protein VMA55_10635 [Acidovorax sp.]|nr:hypothetical protein [Acidovorax sp.]
MIRASILRWARARQPDFVIGGPERPYLRRHWLLPRNKLFNVYVHEFLRSDDDRALHDHPWLFNASWLLDGQYVEHTIAAGGLNVRTLRVAGAFKVRWGGAPHRVELTDGACWTCFITGPRIREWGFHCPEHGWVHWKRFTAADDAGAVGKGCDQ